MTIASSTSVTRSNIISQTYANVYNIINNKTNVPDPSKGTTNRKMVYTREPDVTGINFKGYPLIIISSPEADFSNPTLNGKHKQVSWMLRITVRCSEMPYSNEPRGMEYCDTLTDDIIEALNSETNRITLRGYNLYNLNISTGNLDTTVIEEQLVFERDVNVSFDTRMAISA